MNFGGDLTEREKEILVLLCQEKTAKQIAYELGIGVRTVEGYKYTMMFKTESKSMIGLVIYAIENNIYQLKKTA